MPAENLWDDAEAIEEHFAKVRERKSSEFGGGGGKRRTGYDDAEGGEELASNDLASVFKE